MLSDSPLPSDRSREDGRKRPPSAYTDNLGNAARIRSSQPVQPRDLTCTNAYTSRSLSFHYDFVRGIFILGIAAEGEESHCVTRRRWSPLGQLQTIQLILNPR